MACTFLNFLAYCAFLFKYSNNVAFLNVLKKILQLFTRVYQIYLVQKKGENWLTDHIILNFYLVSHWRPPAIKWLNETRLSEGKAQKNWLDDNWTMTMRKRWKRNDREFFFKIQTLAGNIHSLGCAQFRNDFNFNFNN